MYCYLILNRGVVTDLSHILLCCCPFCFLHNECLGNIYSSIFTAVQDADHQRWGHGWWGWAWLTRLTGTIIDCSWHLFMIVVELLLELRIKWPVDFFGDCSLHRINRHHHNHNHNYHNRTHSTQLPIYLALFSKPRESTPPHVRSMDPVPIPTDSLSLAQITQPSIPKTAKRQTRNSRVPSLLTYLLKSVN